MEVGYGNKMNHTAPVGADDPIFTRRILCARQDARDYDPHQLEALDQFGVWFGAQRRRRGLTLEDLAGLTDLGVDFLAGIELGLEPDSHILAHADRLAAALGQPVLAFINILHRNVSRAPLKNPH